MVEVPEILLHEADEPDVVAHLPQAHPLAGEDGAQVNLPAFMQRPINLTMPAGAIHSDLKAGC